MSQLICLYLRTEKFDYNKSMNGPSTHSPRPSLTAQMLAPLARTWQGVQDGVAKLL